MGRSGASGATVLDFTDGDTLKRFTVVDVQVQQSSTITPAIQRSGLTADADDAGWLYLPNIISVSNGSFDVLVGAFAGDQPQAGNDFPNEQITLTYIID